MTYHHQQQQRQQIHSHTEVIPTSIGIDIGGSHVGIGLLHVELKTLLTSIEFSITDHITPQILIHQITHHTIELLNTLPKTYETQKHVLYRIISVGIGCPGQVHCNRLVAASNLPLFHQIPLTELVIMDYQQKLPKDQCCYYLDECIVGTLINDADAAISAEVWGNAEKYKDYSNIAMLTLGTGIGCGLILNNQLYQGSHGQIEAGHMIITNSSSISGYNYSNNKIQAGCFDRPCGCGQVGCVEAYASARNTALRLAEVDNSQSTTSKNEGNINEKNLLNAKEVFSRYQSHDANAVKVVEEVG